VRLLLLGGPARRLAARHSVGHRRGGPGDHRGPGHSSNQSWHRRPSSSQALASASSSASISALIGPRPYATSCAPALRSAVANGAAHVFSYTRIAAAAPGSTA